LNRVPDIGICDEIRAGRGRREAWDRAASVIIGDHGDTEAAVFFAERRADTVNLRQKIDGRSNKYRIMMYSISIYSNNNNKTDTN
jgi:hypothetical protein